MVPVSRSSRRRPIGAFPRSLFFASRARGSWSSRHTSQFGPFWKMREHVVISSWFGIVGSVFPSCWLSREGLLPHLSQLREMLPQGGFSASIGFCIIARFQQFKHCVLHFVFRARGFPLALGFVSNDGVADCFVTRRGIPNFWCKRSMVFRSFRR